MSTPSPPDLGFIHRFEPATRSGLTPLLLLHGTGGDQNDLIPLGARVAPGRALLSPLGKVRENGMPRFFRRLAEGVFDLDDLKARTCELGDFVERGCAAYGLERPFALGYSNGANVAAALMLLRPGVLAGAMLLRGALPLTPDETPDLRGVPVLILSGRSDPMMSLERASALADLLTTAGADVTATVLETGHGLTPQDLTLAGQWLAERPAASG